MSRHPLLSRIADQIAILAPRACSGASRPGLLVGLSGGPDSVALLLGARQWSLAAGCPLEAAHLNHTLRTRDAEDDLAFCRALCVDLQVPLHEFREDPRPLARARGLGVEEAGRHLRRRLLTGLVRTSDHLHVIATGHHRDDQSETVIMRLFRGTGPQGLRGIRPVQGNVIHPLLGIRRGEILACLQDCGQPWRQDASNEGRDNTRARVRNELLPLARDIFGAGCEANPARLAALSELDQRLLEDLTAQTLSAVAVADGGRSALQVPALLALDPALAGRVLRAWLLGVEEKPDAEGTFGARLAKIHGDLILRWLHTGQSGTGLDLPGGWRLQRDFARLRLERGNGEAVPARHAAADFRILVKQGPAAEDPADRPDIAAAGRSEGAGRAVGPACWELTCPVEALQGNLRVRNPRPGDRLQPFGLPGTRKLSDLLREAGVPRSARAGILVAEDDGGILWVVGVARTERTRLLPTTGKTVTICICDRAGNPKQGT